MAAFRHFALTLTGAAQRLSSVLTPTTPGGEADAGCRQILLAADPTNTAVVYIGSATLSATSHGFSLDPTQASQGPVSIGPFDSGPVRLSELYALGTNNERLMIAIVEF